MLYRVYGLLWRPFFLSCPKVLASRQQERYAGGMAKKQTLIVYGTTKAPLGLKIALGTGCLGWVFSVFAVFVGIVQYTVDDKSLFVAGLIGTLFFGLLLCVAAAILNSRENHVPKHFKEVQDIRPVEDDD